MNEFGDVRRRGKCEASEAKGDIDIIAMLQAVSEGSVDLDLAIEEIVGFAGHPPYTTSIDAALTLVPEGWDEEIKRARHRKGWRVSLALNRGPGIGYDGTTCAIDAPTPALALCIAALAARKEPTK